MGALNSWFRRKKKWDSYPRLLVPITRGPLLGFYHFLTGYFVPTYWEMVNNPTEKHALLHCGPMTPWFDLLPYPPEELIDATEGLQTAYRAASSGFARGHVLKTFTDWDLYRKFSDRPLREVSQHLRERLAGQAETDSAKAPKLLFVTRDYTPDVLRDHPSRSFGSQKRNIPNLAASAHSLSSHYTVEAIDGARATPQEMVTACLTADAIVGQHGAGLTNALFLRPGAKVIEIGWTPADANPPAHFKFLSKELDLPWHYLALQKDQFAAIDEGELQSALKQIFPPHKETA